MLKIYCQKCGSKNEYNKISQKPNFCQSCGNPFNHAASLKRDEGYKNDEYDDYKSDEDDEHSSSSTTVPELTKLDIDIDIGRNKTESLKNLVGTRDNGVLPQDEQGLGSPPPQTEKDFMNEFKREASTLRPKKPER